MAWNALWGLLVSLLSLFGLSALLVRRARMPSASAPLAALGAAVLVLLAGGMAGLLRPAALVLVAVGLAGCVFQLVSAARQKQFFSGPLEEPAARLFWAAALLMAATFACLKPEFLNFDEYSFWGTAAKLTTLHNKLYTACETGLPWQMTELSALPLTSYFFQLWGGFSAWRAIFAANLLMLAAACAAAGCARKGRMAAPVLLAAVLVPCILAAAGHTALLDTAWLEFLGDLPAGMLFGGAVAVWLSVRDKGMRCWWLCLPVLALAGNVKSNTLVLALAAAGLIALDAGIFSADAAGGRRNAAARWGFGAACLATPLVQYLLWTRYTAVLVQQNAASGGMGDTAGASLPAVVLNGCKLLAGLPADSYFEERRALFWEYGQAMQTAFFHRNVSMLGTGAAVAAAVFAVFLLALVLAPNRKARLRTGMFWLGSTVCFGGYWLMLWFSYAFILKDSSPDALASYNRYFSSYYAGWLLLALAVLADSCRTCRRPVRGRAAALAAGAAFALVFAVQAEPQYTVLGISEGEYTLVREEKAVARWAAEYIQPDQRVFLIRQGDNGFYWFLYCQELAPCRLVYGEGGGTYGEPSLEGETDYFAPYTQQEFSHLLEKEQADWLLLSCIDEVFEASYSGLFADKLAAARQGPALYRLQDGIWQPQAVLQREEATA